MVKVIPRFKMYVIWSNGQVWSIANRNKIRRMKPNMARGYERITLCAGLKNRVDPYIHELVCEAFHGPRPYGMQCRHLDGNKLNNCADNLCWGTPQENTEDKRRHGTLKRRK